MDITHRLRESCFCDGRGCELCQAAAEIESLRAELAACREIFTWLLGEGDEFPLRPEGKGLYWWRKELRERIAAARKGEDA